MKSKMKIISRKEAKESGLTRYFTGSPCKYGHIAERFLSCGHCVACSKEKVKKRHKRRYHAEPEFRRKTLDRRLHYAKKNPAGQSERQKIFLKRNAERVKNARREKYLSDPETFRSYGRNRRARIRNSPGKHGKSDIRKLISLQGGRCAGCGIKLKEYHVDHIRPVSRGGSNDFYNLQILCPLCNRTKCAQNVIDWNQRNGKLL